VAGPLLGYEVLTAFFLEATFLGIMLFGHGKVSERVHRVATVAGWYVTEIGRQPYVIYGLLRVDEVASRVPPTAIAFPLALYCTVYFALLVAYVSVIKHTAEKPVEMFAPRKLHEAAA
jgi:cytochrome bd-type quinol oxidase subunit 1